MYVIGGIGGKGGTYEKRLDSVESLELTEEGGKKWRQLSPMSTPRSSHTCEVEPESQEIIFKIFVTK